MLSTWIAVSVTACSVWLMMYLLGLWQQRAYNRIINDLVIRLERLRQAYELELLRDKENNEGTER